ncbi:MAG: hypothetical protein ABSG57_11175 [Candidatus Bathyarchaeia archaeon]
MDNMTIEAEWLSQILGENTRKGYERSIAYFKEFMKTESLEDIIKLRKEERNFETRIIQFFKWVQEKKDVTENSARAYCIAIQSLFTYVGAPLRLKNKLPKLHMKIETWKPSVKELQRLYSLGDISIKAWLSLSRDIPARISDMLRITPEQIESGEFLLQSKKEGVVGKCYISEETKALFRQLRTAKISLPITQAGIDKMMASACKIAGLEKRINQHLLRKIWISTAINLGVPEIVYKILSFKTVPQELLTYYLDRNELKDYWQKVVSALPLEHSNGNNGRVNNIEEALDLVMSALRKLIEEKTMTMRINVMTDKQIIEEYVRESNDRLRIKKIA